MPIRISFLTTIGYNVGDDFIRSGIQAAMDATGIEYQSYYINKLDQHSLRAGCADESLGLDEKYWDADVVIQAGAPVFWHLEGGSNSSVTAAWHQWFWRDRVFCEPAERRHPILLTLGAGSCQPWGHGAKAFIEDSACLSFARAVARRSAIMTVRDPVAAEIVAATGSEYKLRPCPAFFAGNVRQRALARSGPIGINLMPHGGHAQIRPAADTRGWREKCLRLVVELRNHVALFFIAHDTAEYDFMRTLARPGERVFISASWRDYLDVYSHCATVVANRVHGAVCAAGYGVPALIVGTDTRSQIGAPLGLPILHADIASAGEIATAALDTWSRRAHEHDRLRALHKDMLLELSRSLAEVFQHIPAPRASSQRAQPRPSVRLASLQETRSPEFECWMEIMNAFAAERGLRIFETWSKVWEYPWLWREALSGIDWKGKRVIDLGSEISPMPWWLASLGAEVHLVETDPQWISVWENLRNRFAANVHWHIVDSERLPLADCSFDAVTSFSVIEHQPDKAAAVGEVARILKPGGRFALSFDICEPDLGMTFPSWNGKALTIEEFSRVVWLHPAWGNNAVPTWNLEDVEPFLAWHRTTASHHNYVVGAACLHKVFPTAALDTLVLYHGWHAREHHGKDWWAWAQSPAHLGLRAPVGSTATITGDVIAQQTPDRIHLYLDGVELVSFDSGSNAFSRMPPISIPVSCDFHYIELKNERGVSRISGDPRPLAFAVRNLDVQVRRQT